MNHKLHTSRSTWNTPTTGANDRLQRLATLGFFAAGIAHEFNNLMTPAVAAGQMALMTEDPEAARVALRRFLESVERAQGLAESILRLAASDPPAASMSSLRQVAEIAVAISRMELAKTRVRVVMEIPPDAMVQMDGASLLHIILNLILNAQRAMVSTGGVLKLRATLGSAPQQLAWTLEITDTGQGMSDEQAVAALEPFAPQLAQPAGSGIGLPLCRALIWAAGGEISIASSPGRGTTVSIALPSSGGHTRAVA